MIRQRLQRNPDGTVWLLLLADSESVPELEALAEELNARSTVTTEGPVNVLSGPAHPRVK